jgi:hypothetical protein
MKNIWYYLSILMICSCNCDQAGINTTETTGYEVSFPDGRKNSVNTQATQPVPSRDNNPMNPNVERPSREVHIAEADKSKPAGHLLSDKTDYTEDRGVIKPVNPQRGPDQPTNLTALKNVLPTACELLDIKWLEKQMSAKEDILTTNSSSAKNPNVNSCFFRWDNGIIPNCGIFVQVMENPVPEEVENYAHYFIQGKLEGGEVDMSGTTYKYQKYDKVGIAGAYSDEQGKYFWQVGPERLFMLAFNTGLSKSTERKHADAIAQKVMASYEKFLKTQKG